MRRFKRHENQMNRRQWRASQTSYEKKIKCIRRKSGSVNSVAFEYGVDCEKIV